MQLLEVKSNQRALRRRQSCIW